MKNFLDRKKRLVRRYKLILRIIGIKFIKALIRSSNIEFEDQISLLLEYLQELKATYQKHLSECTKEEDTGYDIDTEIYLIEEKYNEKIEKIRKS